MAAFNLCCFLLGLLLVKESAAQCGTINTPRLLNGFPALPCSNPWHVHINFVDEAIDIANPAVNVDNMACSGVIIDSSYVIISPTCLFLLRVNMTTAMETMVLSAGDINIEVTEGTEQYRRPTEMYFHPSYPFRTQEALQQETFTTNSFFWYQDYQAIIVKVEPAFNLVDCVNTICLPPLGQNECSFDDCTLAANGVTQLSPTFVRSPLTQIAKISPLPRAACDALVRSLPGFRIAADGFCGKAETNSLPCVNDAGGPLACSINGVNYLRGTSVSDFCNTLAPPLFWDASLPSSLSFVNDVLNGDQTPDYVFTN